MFKRNMIWNYAICVAIFCAGGFKGAALQSDKILESIQVKLKTQKPISMQDIDKFIAQVNAEFKERKLTTAQLESKLKAAKALAGTLYKTTKSQNLNGAECCVQEILVIQESISEIKENIKTLEGIRTSDQTTNIRNKKEKLAENEKRKSAEIDSLRSILTLEKITESFLSDKDKERLKNLRANLEIVEPKATWAGSVKAFFG